MSSEEVQVVDWMIEAVSFGNCNCDYCCPCQFELDPTHGNCRGVEVARIEKGHFGDVRLDGLCYALVYGWPGPIYEGNGTMQAVIDERADEGQRKALATVLYGGETEEGKTHWWVFHAMANTVYDPLFRRIDLEVDIEGRSARAVIPGILLSTGRPITSKATGEEHRVRIDIPNGMEFEVAEIGSASTQATGEIELELTDTYGQFNVIRHTGRGVVRNRSG